MWCHIILVSTVKFRAFSLKDGHCTWLVTGDLGDAWMWYGRGKWKCRGCKMSTFLRVALQWITVVLVVLDMGTAETRPLDYIGDLTRTNCAMLLVCVECKVQCHEGM